MVALTTRRVINQASLATPVMPRPNRRIPMSPPPPEQRAGTQSTSAALPPLPESAKSARTLVRRTLQRGCDAAVLHTIELLTTELIANAFLHAGTDCRLALVANDGVVRVEVTDDAGGRPTVRRPEATKTHGRGLLLVAELAERWGVDDSAPAGKTVWFELRL